VRSKSKLFEYIINSVQAQYPELNPEQVAQREIARLAEALEMRYANDWKQQVATWENNKAVLVLILGWLEQNATSVMSWRTPTNRLMESWRCFRQLIEDYDEIDSSLTDIFESEVKNLLEVRRAKLESWMQQLWAEERVICYALWQNLKAHSRGEALDQTEIEVAFAEKVDAILLTYNPTLANHASLKTYAVTVIFRALIDRLRKLGYKTVYLSSTGGEEKSSITEEQLDYSAIDQNRILGENLRQASLDLCRVTLREIGKKESGGSCLSRTRRSLMCINLVELVITGSQPNALLPSQAARALLNLLDSNVDQIVKTSLETINRSQINESTIKNSTNPSQQTTLQMLSLDLKLGSNMTANAAQISQARRVLATRPAVIAAVVRFLNSTPYQAADKEKLQHTPLKIMDYCFKHLGHYFDLSQDMDVNDGKEAS
jgi:hypothetical protein